MSQKILLAPAYADRRAEVEDILRRFDTDGRVVYQDRNIIKVFATSDGREWNVKRYCVPNIVNRIAYGLVRKPKGLRAFIYPQRLIDAGFETPAPVAYAEQRSGGLLGYSWFISEQCHYGRRFYEFGDASLDSCRAILDAFAAFSARLHEAGIYHCDYSPGNILFDEMADGWHFSLVDINRMQFDQQIDLRRGCANFARLWGQPEWFRYLAQAYAREREADAGLCEALVMEARRQFWSKFSRRHTFGYTLRY